MPSKLYARFCHAFLVDCLLFHEAYAFHSFHFSFSGINVNFVLYVLVFFVVLQIVRT